MEIHPEVYRWLGTLQLVPVAATNDMPPVTRSGKILLDDAAAASFENGQGFGTLLSNLGALRGMPPAPIDTFRIGGSPVSRLYNWNLLGPVLKPFGIELSIDTKALVVAGDVDVVGNILAQFYERVIGPLPDLIRPPSTPAGGSHFIAGPAPAATPSDNGNGNGNGTGGGSGSGGGGGGGEVHSDNGGYVDPHVTEPASGHAAAVGRSIADAGSATAGVRHEVTGGGRGRDWEGTGGGRDWEGEGPAAAPLPRLAREAPGAMPGIDPFDTVRGDPIAPGTALELLGQSVEGPFGLGDGEGETMLSGQPTVFREWMRMGRKPGGVVGAALVWLDSMHLELPALVALLSGRRGSSGGPGSALGDDDAGNTNGGSSGGSGGASGGAKGRSLGTVSACFDVLGAGLVSQDPAVVTGTLRLLSSAARGLGAASANSETPVLEYARQWLTAVGGPTVTLTALLCDAGEAANHGNIRVGDAKAAAEAAAAAAADAAEGFTPDYEDNPEAVAGAHFSLGYHGGEGTDRDGGGARRAAVAAAIAELVDRFCRRTHLHAFLLEHLRVGADARTNPKRYIDALNVLVPALLARGPGPRRVLAAEQTPSAMLLESLRCAEGPADLREASLTLLTTLWSAFPDEVEVRGEDCRLAVSVLKRAARDPQPSSQIHALACLFQLLHAFIAAANAFSPVVYKTIVFMLIEHMRNDAVRDFITAELKVALDAHPNIPVGILVDPVVKQASPGGQHPGVKRVDFELMASMAEHARLEARPALHILALCLRAALDHRGGGPGSGDNPPEDRAVALRAAMRLTARLRLRYPEGGQDPAFAETQRAAAEVLLCTAQSMSDAGGPGVGHLRGIIRTAASKHAARHGVSHPDMEAALSVLAPTVGGGGGSEGDEGGRSGEYFARRRVQPEDKLAPGTRAPPLPPAHSGGGASPLASHQLLPPTQQQQQQHSHVPRAGSSGNDSLRTEVLEEGDLAGGPSPQPNPNPNPKLRHKGGGGPGPVKTPRARQGAQGDPNALPPPPIAVGDSDGSTLEASSFGSNPKAPLSHGHGHSTHDKPWLPKPATAPKGKGGSDYVASLRGAEAAVALDRAIKLRSQREKREEEIRQIGQKRAEKERKQREAEETEARDKERMMAKLKKRREDLAAAAATHSAAVSSKLKSLGRDQAGDGDGRRERRGRGKEKEKERDNGAGTAATASPRPKGRAGGGPSAEAAAAMLPPYTQELVLEALNERLARNPNAELPEGYERVARPAPAPLSASDLPGPPVPSASVIPSGSSDPLAPAASSTFRPPSPGPGTRYHAVKEVHSGGGGEVEAEAAGESAEDAALRHSLDAQLASNPQAALPEGWMRAVTDAAGNAEGLEVARHAMEGLLEATGLVAGPSKDGGGAETPGLRPGLRPGLGPEEEEKEEGLGAAGGDGDGGGDVIYVVQLTTAARAAAKAERAGAKRVPTHARPDRDRGDTDHGVRAGGGENDSRNSYRSSGTSGDSGDSSGMAVKLPAIKKVRSKGSSKRAGGGAGTNSSRRSSDAGGGDGGGSSGGGDGGRGERGGEPQDKGRKGPETTSRRFSDVGGGGGPRSSGESHPRSSSPTSPLAAQADGSLPPIASATPKPIPPKEYPDSAAGYAAYALEELLMPGVHTATDLGAESTRRSAGGMDATMGATGRAKANGFLALKRAQQKEVKEREGKEGKRKAALDRRKQKERAEKLKKEVEANREIKLVKEAAKKKEAEAAKAQEESEAKVKHKAESRRREAQRKKVVEFEVKRRAELAKHAEEEETKRLEEEHRKRKASKELTARIKAEKEKADAEAAEAKHKPEPDPASAQARAEEHSPSASEGAAVAAAATAEPLATAQPTPAAAARQPVDVDAPTGVETSPADDTPPVAERAAESVAAVEASPVEDAPPVAKTDAKADVPAAAIPALDGGAGAAVEGNGGAPAPAADGKPTPAVEEATPEDDAPPAVEKGADDAPAADTPAPERHGGATVAAPAAEGAPEGNSASTGPVAVEDGPTPTVETPADDGPTLAEEKSAEVEATPVEGKPAEDAATPVEGKSAEDEATPAVEKSAEDEATPAEGKPAEDEATPAENKSAENEATPAEEKSAEDEATPAEGKPAEDEATPAEGKPVEDEATPAENKSAEDEATPAEEKSAEDEATAADTPAI